MKAMIGTALVIAVSGFGAPAWACDSGLYRSLDGAAQAAVIQLPDANARYTFADGRRGQFGSPNALLACVNGGVGSVGAGGRTSVWTKVPLKLTETKFKSHEQTLSGVLIEAPTPGPHPLVVMVHGSERTSPRQSTYPYILASYGLTVFAYDKRGTGRSEGEYTQNFELLADDAAAALKEARRLDAGRFIRAGFFGASQGGWIAPLAATRSSADFVAVGFGLIASPVEEDRDQVISEMREKGYGARDIEDARQVAEAAGRIVASHFTSGFDQFDQLKQRYSARPWFRQIKGEYTGDMLAEGNANLRRVGRALFDDLELIWDYDGPGAIRRVKAPILWIVAEKDREAPPELTLARLASLGHEGAKLTVYSFPDTDHGMYEFTEAADGTRAVTRVTDGYFRLLTDWIKGVANGPYGRARRR